MATKKKTTATIAPAPTVQKALVLRTSDKNGMSYNGTFQWPASGPVQCADWSPEAQCGHGLHGLLDGLGDYIHLTMGEGETVQVLEVERGDELEAEITNLRRQVQAATDGAQPSQKEM